MARHTLGHFYQPEDLGAREDVTDVDCVTENVAMSFDRHDLQVLTTKLDMCQITLREAKLHVLRLGYFIKGQSKARFLRELARAIETKEESANEGNRIWSCATTGEWSCGSLSSSGSAS